MFNHDITYGGIDNIKIGDTYNYVIERLDYLQLLQKYSEVRAHVFRDDIFTCTNNIKIDYGFQNGKLFCITITQDMHDYFDPTKEEIKKKITDIYGTPTQFKKNILKWYDDKNVVEYSLDDFSDWEFSITKKREFNNTKRIIELALEKLKYILYIIIALMWGLVGLLMFLSGDYIPLPY